MKPSWWKVLFALLLPSTAIYWMLAGHDLGYTMNPGPGEYEEAFSTQGRIIISCIAGVIWSVALTMLFVIVRWIRHKFRPISALRIRVH